MRRLSLFSLILLAGFASRAQSDTTLARATQIPGAFADFTADNLGNVYVITGDNQLKKFGPAGDSLAVYNEVRRYGPLYSVDVSNPLKILLYYRDFSTVVAVDRFLAPINTVDLRPLNLIQVKAIGLAYNNNIWVYDDVEAKLKSVRDDGSLASETTDIRQFVDSVPDPVRLIDDGGLVYLYDPHKGAYLFDHYGAFQQFLPIPGWTDFDVIGGTMLGHDAGAFFKVPRRARTPVQDPLPAFAAGARKVLLAANRFYVLRPSGITIFAP